MGFMCSSARKKNPFIVHKGSGDKNSTHRPVITSWNLERTSNSCQSTRPAG